jgi:hypothetical protein
MGGKMAIEDTVLAVIDSLKPERQTAPEPQHATVEDIAEWCGIRNVERIPEWRVPVDQYRHAGSVACSRTGRQPDPPWVVVARYELLDGTRAVMTADRYAEELQAAYGLEQGEAVVLARHRAGWTARDLRQDWPADGHDHTKAEQLLEDAKAAV